MTVPDTLLTDNQTDPFQETYRQHLFCSGRLLIKIMLNMPMDIP